MKTEEIIAMAREAGLTYDCYGKECCAVQEDADLEPELLRFAALVAAKEREACAQVADAQHFGGAADDDLAWTTCAAHIAAAIRTRASKGEA